MRTLILSDIHANLTALEAVLAAAAGRYDRVWFLGDLVGYGPDPNECIDRLRGLDALCLSGNHDWAVLGKLDASDFNAEARRIVDWTRETLTAENREFLNAQPPGATSRPSRWPTPARATRSGNMCSTSRRRWTTSPISTPPIV